MNHSRAGGEQQADGVVEVVGGDDAALFATAGALLQERVERHDEEARRHAEQREHQHGTGIRAAREEERDAEDAHEGGPSGHEAEFDFVAGETAGEQAAGADSRRRGRWP